MASTPVIALTPGEPAGVGPEIVLGVARESFNCALVAIADPDLLIAHARRMQTPVRIVPWDGAPHRAGELRIMPIRLARAATPGTLEPANAAYVLQTLRRAAAGCIAGEFNALVTGPVHKGVINDAGVAFSGHTELLAELTGAPLPVMLLVADTLRIALITTHLPLARVPTAITTARIIDITRIIDADVRRRFGIARPRIAVCGLNPHAGEGGYLGREEIDIIAPAIRALRDDGIAVSGPVPADTAFVPARLADTDVVLAMYHDQGLPVIKHAGFGQVVNITLGLPIIRTSVDHGTALDIAGRGTADPASLRAAIRLAADFAQRAGGTT